MSCGDFDANILREQCKKYGTPEPRLFSRWLNIKDMALQEEAHRHNDVDVVELAESLDGMNRISRHFGIPGIDGIQLHHFGMYDTSKIAMIFLYLVRTHGYRLKPTTIGDPSDRTRTDPRPTTNSVRSGIKVRDFWDRAGAIDDIVIAAIRAIDQPLTCNDFNIRARRMLVALSREGLMSEELQLLTGWAQKKGRSSETTWWVERVLKARCEHHKIIVKGKGKWIIVKGKEKG